MVMALLTPFAVDIALLPGMELSMPVEPMMILFTAIFIFRVLLQPGYDRRLLRHPVTIAVFFFFCWMLITSATSSIPAVSFKYLAARLWFVIPFFFAAAHIFRQKERMWQFVACYAISLVVVILISTSKTLGNFHDLQTLHRVMQPFYNDHTAYGCVIGLFVPIVLHYLIEWRGKGWQWPLLLVSFVAMLVGLFFSYSRAAWISVLGAAAVYVAVRMGMKVRWMTLFFVVFVCYGFCIVCL